MQVSVALRARAKLALLFKSLLHAACQGNDQQHIDPRNMRTFRQLLLALLAKRSTRLLALAQAILPQRRATGVKAVAMGLGYFLEKAKFPMQVLAIRLLEVALRRLAPERLARYRGKVLLVIDPTDYAKRSRGRGKRGRQMQYIGRVRKAKAGRKRWVFQQQLERAAAGENWHDEGWVFTSRTGRYVEPRKVNVYLQEAIEAVGLEPITVHGLRHTFCTWLLRNSVPVKDVSDTVGHSKPSVTLNLYWQSIPGVGARVSAKVSELLAPTLPATLTALAIGVRSAKPSGETA